MADDPVESQAAPAPIETASAQTTEEAASVAEQQSATVQPTAPPSQPPLFQGKYKSAEEGFWHLKGQVDALQTRPSEPAADKKPQFTTEQLWTHRAAKLQEMAAAQVAGEADKAATAAAQVNWIDNQILDQRLSAESKKWQGQSTMQQLVSEGAELLKPYQSDLVPGTPLNEEAVSIFNRGQMAFEAETGQPMSQAQKQLLSAYSVLAAAAKTGKITAGVAQQARTEFAQALNQAAKQAVVAGGGAVGKATAKSPDFMTMTDEEFRAYERKIGVISE